MFGIKIFQKVLRRDIFFHRFPLLTVSLNNTSNIHGYHDVEQWVESQKV